MYMLRMNPEKISPFEQTNENEKLDEKFFVRMTRFETYYKELSKNDEQFLSNYKILREINK